MRTLVAGCYHLAPYRKEPRSGADEVKDNEAAGAEAEGYGDDGEQCFDLDDGDRQCWDPRPIDY